LKVKAEVNSMDMTNGPKKVIVAVAPVGRSVEPPAVNPLTPEQVAGQVVDCAGAGASMVHLHVRDKEGNQTENLSQFSKTLDLIRKTSDIIIQGSTGGLSTLTLEERCVSLNDPRVEVASLNMGSVNFGEEVYINRLPDIRHWARRMEQTHVVPELEVFEVGMMPAVRKLISEGALKPPYHFNFCLGFHWALPADPGSLFFLASMLNQNEFWGVIHDGMRDLSLLATALGIGATVVRVGFEDSIFYAPGKAAKANPELVEKLVSLIRQIGFDVASPAEARAMLRILKG
jgi:3-keto-5-aminohexanoate cleavage enzyme